MNRRQMLAAASTLALAGCGGEEKKDAAKEAPKEPAKAQDFVFKSHLNLTPSSTPRALTPHEIYSEAQVATMLLIALHKTPRESILLNEKPTGKLAGVDPVIYGKVRDYMTKYPDAGSALISFQATVQDVTLYAAESSDDAGYTGPPEGCLSSANTDLIVKALATVPKA